MATREKYTRRTIIGIIFILIVVFLLLLLRKCSEGKEPYTSLKQTQEQRIDSRHQGNPPSVPYVEPDTLQSKFQIRGSAILPAKKQCLAKGTSSIISTDTLIEPDTTIIPKQRIVDEERISPAEKPTEDTISQRAKAKPSTDTHILSQQAIKHHEFRLGVYLGAGYSSITRLGGIAESASLRPQYTLEEKSAFAPAIGLLSSWRYGRIGAELSISYINIGSMLKEYQTLTHIEEITNYRFHCLSSELMLRAFTYRDFYLGAGVGLLLPFTSRGIDYTSSRPASLVAVDELMRMHLREALEPRLQLMPAIKLGYASSSLGLELGLEYRFGATDLIRTRANNYGYNEVKNNTHLFLFSLGYSFPLKK